GDGTYTYIAQDTYEYLAAGETATETFSYTVTDNLGASSTNTVTVTITGTNDAPVATALSGTVSEDGPGLTVMASYTDLDASDMHTFSVDTTGTLGTVINNNDGTFSYDPNGQFESLATGETATDTFTYTVDDGNGGTTTETVTVTITGQNDAPDLTPLTAIAQEDGPSITVSANFTDVDSDGPFVISIDTSSTVGSVTDNGDGTFTYHANGQFEYLNAGETATDTFTYTVSDEDGGSSTETITVTVEGQVEPTKFTASDGAFADYFGASTAINDHGVVLVGAPLNDDPGANSGYIYLYRPDGSGGYSEQILNASIPIAGVQYGYSVALNNSEVAVVGSFDRNQVHVYQPDGNGGHFETKLLPAGTLYSDLFGHSVA
ncbi:FG-GAP repeat protein, partial [Labrenzia sp. OB1]|uniref:FG-GAP repeat protein n=1 Tax=Labrenzia sp. OB1 TaxID=1561204 RepID=UPI0012E7963C